jgi:hypothetical protein
MTVWLGAVLDVRGRRPRAATGAAVLGVTAGFATLSCSAVVIAAAFEAVGAEWAVVAVMALALVQVSAGVLLVVGGVRMAAGAGRRVLLAGIVLEFVTCAVHALHALNGVMDNPQDGPRVAAFFLIVAGMFAALAAGCLYLALRPAARWFLTS